MESAVDTSTQAAPVHERPGEVLKDHDTFLVADQMGNIKGQSDGLFIDDTRMLSRFNLQFAGHWPQLLSAAVDQENLFFTSHLTNPELVNTDQTIVPQGVLYIERRYFLWKNTLFVRLNIDNFSEHTVSGPLELRYDADFLDMFEIRGQHRGQRGQTLSPLQDQHSITLRYRGLDKRLRHTTISFSQPPTQLSPQQAVFALQIPAHGQWSCYLEVGEQRHEPSQGRFSRCAVKARRSMRERFARGAAINSSGPLFQAWFDKARADLALLTSELPTGPYPYAGIPWFSTPFGRDAIITALQMLWFEPSLARGVLNYLAAHQAVETSSFRDAQPGKIMHETRRSEMTATAELPFGRYYGGVDTTPLFVMLAGAYYRRTADDAFINQIWPQLQAAIDWLEQRLDSNPLGLLDYQRGEQSGLANQGWKDSHNSVSHADGRLAEGPIALVEVQGYAFRALLDMAELGALTDTPSEQILRWRERAAHLREQVEALFWQDDMQFYALALDGQQQPCRVEASNVGHLLYVGLPTPARAQKVIQRLLSPAFDCGWGIRTLASTAARFNPMSYHNGSVWPHDVALCCAGMARYGEQEGVANMLRNMFSAALHFALRLPELFCGFERTSAEGPIIYPVACQPQSWASGAVFMMLHACLGVDINAVQHTVRVNHPALPQGMDTLTLTQLAVGEHIIDLTFRNINGQTVVLINNHSTEPVSLQINH